MRTRDKEIKLRLTEAEAETLKTYAERCGLTQSAFLRMLLQRRRPKPIPTETVWQIMNMLYEIHNKLPPKEQQELEAVILRLQSVATLPEVL